MTERPRRAPCPGFEGILHRTARPDQLERAHKHSRRFHERRRAEAKLDEVLGPVEEEDELG